MSHLRGFQMKFTKKSIVLASIYMIFSFATISYFFYMAYDVVEDKQEELLVLELENTMNQISQNFLEIETTLYNIDSHLMINSDESILLDYLVEIDQESEAIASLYLGKADKTMVNSSGFVPGPDFDLTTRIWYMSAVESEDIIFTPSFINASEDRVIVTAAKAVYKDNIFIGVIAADIDVRTITGFVSEKQIGDDGFAFLIDKNNHLLAYPDLDIDTIELKSVDYLESDVFDFSGSGIKTDFSMRGEVGVFAYNTIQSDEYFLGVFLPNNEFASSLRIMSIIFFSLTGAMILLALFLVFIYNLRVRKPLEILIEDIESIDISKTTDYRLPEPQKDDYLNIRNALNRTLDATDFFFQERQDALHQLAIENQRVKLLVESAADIIFEIDMDKKYLSVFGRGLNSLNLKSNDFIGKSVIEMFGTSGKGRDIAYSKALKGEHSIYDWEQVINGKTLYFESSISPIYDKNKSIIGAVGITRDITEPMQKQKEIEYISIHDFLTGLYNRRYFVEAFINVDNEDNYPLGIMMIDLNGLKILNDAYGHDAGDEALIKVATVLKNISGYGDIVCRIGGDEFAILSTQTNSVKLEKLKETIRLELADELVENIPVSVAIGYDIKNNKEKSYEELMKYAENLMYRNKLTEGKSVRNNSIKAILKTLTDKFEEEKTHSTRVSELCKKMGEVLHIKSDDLKELEIAGLFHDIGKISIPDNILHKPGKLTKEEFDIVKTHTENGYNILRAADEYSNLAEYALTHHEYWNGQGYPRGLKEKEIPLFSRIICIVDAYEAMTSDRVYRKRMSEEYAVNEIIKFSGSQFDPKLAKIFVEKVLEKRFE